MPSAVAAKLIPLPELNVILLAPPADIPVNAEPSPLNDVAVKIPVTTAPVFVVSIFLLLLKYNST